MNAQSESRENFTIAGYTEGMRVEIKNKENFKMLEQPKKIWRTIIAEELW